MYRISALYTRLEYPLRGYIAKGGSVFDVVDERALPSSLHEVIVDLVQPGLAYDRVRAVMVRAIGFRWT